MNDRAGGAVAINHVMFSLNVSKEGRNIKTFQIFYQFKFFITMIILCIHEYVKNQENKEVNTILRNIYQRDNFQYSITALPEGNNHIVRQNDFKVNEIK